MIAWLWRHRVALTLSAVPLACGYACVKGGLTLRKTLTYPATSTVEGIPEILDGSSILLFASAAVILFMSLVALVLYVQLTKIERRHIEQT